MQTTSVSTGQALQGLQAAFTKDTIEQQGKIALQQIEAVAATNQPKAMESPATVPGEQVGKNINITA